MCLSVSVVHVKPGIPVHCLSIGQVVDQTFGAAEAAERNVLIFTINPEFVVHARRRPEFLRVLQRSTINTVDGAGLELYIRLSVGIRPERLTGRALFASLVDQSRSRSIPVMLIGSTPRVRKAAEAKLAASGVRVLPGASPALTLDASGRIEIARPERCIVFVALGVVKQEFVIWRLSTLWGSNGYVFVGCGGVLDYFVGAVPAPPRVIAGLGLEWLFRLVTQFRRRWRRQAATLPWFILRYLLPALMLACRRQIQR